MQNRNAERTVSKSRSEKESQKITRSWDKTLELQKFLLQIEVLTLIEFVLKRDNKTHEAPTLPSQTLYRQTLNKIYDYGQPHKLAEVCKRSGWRHHKTKRDYYLLSVWICAYDGGGFIHDPSGLRMWRLSDANSFRYVSAGMTRKYRRCSGGTAWSDRNVSVTYLWK